MRLQHDVSEMETYIREAARARGIDPDIAIRVARAEGLGPGIWQSNYRKNGIREPSYGPFQLLVGGPGTGFPKGMGNDFQRITGLDPSDPANAYEAVDFALDQAAVNGWGAWYGRRPAGVGIRDGLRNAKPIGIRGTNINPLSEDLASYSEAVEIDGRVQPMPVDTSLGGLFNTPSLPGVDGGIPTERNAIPVARRDNPANPSFPDNAVGPLADRDSGQAIPRTVADLLSGAPDGSFIPGGPAERALFGEPTQVTANEPRNLAASMAPTISIGGVTGGDTMPVAPTPVSAVQPTPVSPVSEELPTIQGQEVRQPGLARNPFDTMQGVPQSRFDVAFDPFQQETSLLGANNVPPTVQQATAPPQATPAPAATPLPALDPPVSVPTQQVASPAPAPSVKTVTNAIPDVAETVEKYGLDPNPEGAAYGFSPWGSGIAKVYDNAPENVKIAASGPGLFGAFNDQFGTNIGIGPGRMAMPLTTALGAGAVTAGLGPLGLAIPLAGMLGGSRWGADRLDLVPRNQRQPIEPQRKGLFGNVAEKVGGLFGGNNDRITFDGPLGRNQSNERDSRLSEAAQREVERATRGLY